MIKIKRSHFYWFISVLLSGIVFLPESVENCTDKKPFRCQVKRAWYCDGFICYLLNTTTREVVVKFSKPPEHYGFTEFEVTLKNKTAGRKQKVYIAEYNHTFTNITSGVYQIWVMPYKRDYCSQCKTVATENFKVEIGTGEPVTNDHFAKSTTSEDSVSKADTQRTTTDDSVHVTKDQLTKSTTTKSTTSEDSVSKADTQRTTTDDSVHVTKDQLIKSTTTKSTTSEDSVSKADTQRTTTDDSVHVTKEQLTKPTTTNSTTSENSLSEEHSQQPTKSQIQDSMGIVGSVLCIGLAVVILLCCYNRRRSAGDAKGNHISKETGVATESTVTMELVKRDIYLNNHNVEQIKLQRRPKLFVLYEEDHFLHRKVVDNFTLYLQNYCYCHVMSGYLHLDTTWLHQDIQDADYVIIVNSKLAYGFYKSLLSKNLGHMENQGCTENGCSGNAIVPGINCILQKFLQQPSYDKIVMVYFDYTIANYIIPEICSGYNYKLMKNFTELLMYIHKLKRTDNLAQYDLPLDGKYFLKPAGRDLQNIIRKAAAYERENSNGFSYAYPNLRSISSASDESGFDSGFQHEPISHHFVSSHFQSHMDSDSQDAIPLTSPVLTEYRKSTNPRPYVCNSQARKCQGKFAFEYGGQRNNIAYINETTTAADCGVEFDFVPPDDDDGEFETASMSKSEQMMQINTRYSGAENDNKEYET